MDTNYKELLDKITCFIFDVDGVLTDGNLLINQDGQLLRSMNVKDGYAMKVALEKGYRICIISGGTNEGVRERLEALGIHDVYLGAHNKIEILDQYLTQKNITLDEVAYMGDDIPDIYPMKKVVLPTCPQNAVPEVKKAALYISHKNGGDACARDLIEQVLKTQGKWVL